VLTWTVVGLLAIGVYGQRAIGAVAIDTARLDHRWQRVLTALPLAIISAVIALQTVTSDRTFTIDARLAGIVVAGLCAWRKLPLLVTVLAAAATTAALRAMT
jgi:branched-subunit amino acid transport protein